MTNYPNVLSRLYPNAEWTLNGDTYDGLTWMSDSPVPTQEELDAAWPQVQIDIANERAEKSRRDAYREEADPLFFSSQRGEATEAEWLAKVEEIRGRFPYQ